MASSSGDYDCIICVEVFVSVVEFTCCGNLFFFEKCSSRLRECFSRKNVPFKMTTNNFASKLIGQPKLGCLKYKLQSDSMQDKDQLCEMKELILFV